MALAIHFRALTSSKERNGSPGVSDPTIARRGEVWLSCLYGNGKVLLSETTQEVDERVGLSGSWVQGALDEFQGTVRSRA